MSARIRLIAVGAVVVVLGAWWGYPSAAREPSRLDVVIAGDGQVAQAAEPLVRRVRELGMTVELVQIDLCASQAEIERLVVERAPSILVLSPSAGTCADDVWAAADAIAGGARVIGLVQPGSWSPGAIDAVAAAGIEVVDATRLLGDRSVEAIGAGGEADVTAPSRLPCQWWDDCEPDGHVTVRDAGGALTAAGGERLARTLAGALP